MRKPQVHNAMELEALVQQMGFLPVFSCSTPNYSIEEFTPDRYWFVDGVDGLCEWRMELARRGVVAYEVQKGNGYGKSTHTEQWRCQVGKISQLGFAA